MCSPQYFFNGRFTVNAGGEYARLTRVGRARLLRGPVSDPWGLTWQAVRSRTDAEAKERWILVSGEARKPEVTRFSCWAFRMEGYWDE